MDASDMQDDASQQSDQPLHRAPSQSASQRPPTKGILKTPTPSIDTADRTHLTWDEANLVINEGQRDSTMKITEPKTPFVRYNPETDEVMNLETIPGFELGMAEDAGNMRSPPGSSGPSSRHSSFSAHSRPSGSRRSSSDSSEKRVDIILDENAQHGGIDPDADDEDVEANMTPEELAKHRQFTYRRGSHYRNEAEAMKRAAALMAQEDEDESALMDEDEDDRTPAINGTSHLDDDDDGEHPPAVNGNATSR